MDHQEFQALRWDVNSLKKEPTSPGATDPTDTDLEEHTHGATQNPRGMEECSQVLPKQESYGDDTQNGGTCSSYDNRRKAVHSSTSRERRSSEQIEDEDGSSDGTDSHGDSCHENQIKSEDESIGMASDTSQESELGVCLSDIDSNEHKNVETAPEYRMDNVPIQEGKMAVQNVEQCNLYTKIWNQCSTQLEEKSMKRKIQCDTQDKESKGEKTVAHGKARKSKLKRRKEFECVLCKEHFQSTLALKTHSCTDSEKTKFHCPFEGCDKAYSTPYSVNSHYTRRHSQVDQDHMCDLCGKTFPQREKLTSHMISHSDARDYKCQFPGCDKCFKFKSSLKKHVGIHTDERYICEHEGCDKIFTARRYLARHIVRIHSNLIFTCSYEGCDKIYKTKNGLQEHTETAHNPCAIQCPICNKFLSSKSVFSRHKRIVHSDVRKFICELCGDSFKMNATLKVHMVTHTKNQRFRCTHPGCDKAYTAQHSLSLHELTHKGEKKTFSKRKRSSFAENQGSEDSRDHVDVGSEPMPFPGYDGVDHGGYSAGQLFDPARGTVGEKVPFPLYPAPVDHCGEEQDTV